MTDLTTYLTDWAGPDQHKQAIAKAMTGLAEVSIKLSKLIAQGALAGKMAEVIGDNADGDAQKALDIQAHDMCIEEFRKVPISVVISEEAEEPVYLDTTAPIIVAIDPLDGSSNIDTNVSIGTIFSFLPTPDNMKEGDVSALLQKGTEQLAAGFTVYGPQTSMVFTLGDGVLVFILDEETGKYLLAEEGMKIPSGKREYAINASNHRHWESPVATFIEECIEGKDGPRGEDYNMRWVGSLVAEAYRILVRGGIFLYPRDARAGYQQGRLRLVYEANPVSFLIEQAGGMATEGEFRVMEKQPEDIHQRAPLVFGDNKLVDRVRRYHAEIDKVAARAPLFGSRNVLR
ncbi:MAG: class 1 fructose-bisphosphatase [bacterium]